VTEEEIESWIASVAGQSVEHLERVGYGASRATYIAKLQAGDDLVVRLDTGDGPMAGTELSLAREAEVYRALDDTVVRIPHLHAVAPDGAALLVDRAAGIHELDVLSEAERLAVYTDFLAALADLHQVDPSTLELPSFRQPTDGPSHALEELDLWGRILDDRTKQPWPLAHFTRAVLRRCAPEHVSRTVLCHGDVGPGNFVHEGGRVTALLDWEFSHLGDPMDDLGWWVFRGHDMAGGCGDLRAQLVQWSATTGLPVDSPSIEYYRAFVMFRWLVSVASALDQGGGGMDRSVYFGLVPILSIRLTRALAGLLGQPLAEPPPPPAGEPTPAAAVIQALDADLRDVIGPAVQSTEGRRRLVATMLYLSHLTEVDRIGAAVWALGLDDVEQLTGRRPRDVADGQRLVAELMKSPEPPWAEAIDYFWRDAHRQLALWPLVAPRALTEPTPVPTDVSTDAQGAATDVRADRG
jgi:aminoglycoside phosphotransferase (APT) family kinase protein